MGRELAVVSPSPSVLYLKMADHNLGVTARGALLIGLGKGSNVHHQHVLTPVRFLARPANTPTATRQSECSRATRTTRRLHRRRCGWAAWVEADHMAVSPCSRSEV